MRKLFEGTFCFAWGILVTATAFAQSSDRESFYVEPAFTLDHWRVDRLPVNSVSQIIQTPNEYFWLATFDGLVRFDGIRLKQTVW